MYLNSKEAIFGGLDKEENSGSAIRRFESFLPSHFLKALMAGEPTTGMPTIGPATASASPLAWGMKAITGHHGHDRQRGRQSRSAPT